MPDVVLRRLSKEEVAESGDRIYEQDLAPTLDESAYGKYAVIDVETGAFEVAADALAATDRLYQRAPKAQPWLVRIGSRSARRYGTRNRRPRSRESST